jgi:hypothetical protein
MTKKRKSGYKRRQWSDEDTAFIRRNAHIMTAAQLAEKYGVSPAAISNKCIRMGVRLEKSGQHHDRARYSDDVIEQARTLHDNRVPVKEIQRITGIKTLTYVYDILAYSRRTGILLSGERA